MVSPSSQQVFDGLPRNLGPQGSRPWCDSNRPLDRHGFLLDIDDKLDGLVKRYGDRTLNELREFEGLNASVENFARIVNDLLLVTTPNVRALWVTIGEDDNASTAYRRPLGGGVSA